MTVRAGKLSKSEHGISNLPATPTASHYESTSAAKEDAEAFNAPVGQPDKSLTDVFEVYGPTANGHGWDFMVYKSVKELENSLWLDLDALEEGEEVRIIFRRYTQSQIEDVVYE